MNVYDSELMTEIVTRQRRSTRIRSMLIVEIQIIFESASSEEMRHRDTAYDQGEKRARDACSKGESLSWQGGKAQDIIEKSKLESIKKS